MIFLQALIPVPKGSVGGIGSDNIKYLLSPSIIIGLMMIGGSILIYFLHENRGYITAIIGNSLAQFAAIKVYNAKYSDLGLLNPNFTKAIEEVHKGTPLETVSFYYGGIILSAFTCLVYLLLPLFNAKYKTPRLILIFFAILLISFIAGAVKLSLYLELFESDYISDFMSIYGLTMAIMAGFVLPKDDEVTQTTKINSENSPILASSEDMKSLITELDSKFAQNGQATLEDYFLHASALYKTNQYSSSITEFDIVIDKLKNNVSHSKEELKILELSFSRRADAKYKIGDSNGAISDYYAAAGYAENVQKYYDKVKLIKGNS